jgi:filamentous hemagglutinin family protein
MWLKLASQLTLFMTIAYAYTPFALAQQITADTTLPLNQRTQVTNNNPNFQIDGGATQSTNLFHSFREFSVPAGGEAFFNNAITVQNIISRVTGSTPSDIQGTIRTNGTANLFLINPQGILFGPNARLDIGGSFIASTASSVRFADGIEFSATNPDVTPLLTISQPVGLQFGLNPGRIENQSSPTGLQVQPNQTLALVGGDVTLTGGIVTAPNGNARIELGSVAGNNIVQLTSTPTGYTLGYEGVSNFQDINLQQATVNTIGDRTGSIHIQAANVTLTDRSLIQVGMYNAGTGEGLTVNASESVQLTGSGTRLLTNNEGTATTGDLTVNTPRLLIQNGAAIVSSTSGSRTPGNVNINASQVEVTGSGSQLFTQTESLATGTAGDLTINTADLLIQNGAQIFSGTLGAGNAGNVNIEASQLVEVTGSSSRLLVQPERQVTGNPGNLTITTPVLRVSDNAQIVSATFGSQKGGDVNINASQLVEVTGSGSQLFTQTESPPSDAGTAGDLTIKTADLLIQNGAQIFSATLGAGNTGNVNIEASQSVGLLGVGSRLLVQPESQATGNGGNLAITTPVLRMSDGAQVLAGTLGAGEGGNLTVNASNLVELIGRSPNGEVASGLFNQTQGTGQAGSLEITTPVLRASGGAQVSVGTLGVGEGGNLTVNASNSVELIGRSADNEFASGLFSQSERQATGKAGNLTIITPVLRILDGAQVSAGTLGAGDGGNLTVNANRSVELVGLSADNRFPGGLFTQSQGSGKAGTVTVTTPVLRVLDGAEVSAATLNVGDGGSVVINAAESLFVENGSQISVSSTGETAPAGSLNIDADLVRLDGGRLVAQTLSGNGGNMTLNIADLLLLRRGSAISTTAGTNASGGNGGNILINIPNGFIVAILSENSDITANAFTGIGGRIDITAQSLFGIQSVNFNTPESDITASSQFGINGEVIINTPDVDPSRGFVALNASLADSSQNIGQGCTTADSSQGSQFTITGRGGLPPSPNDSLSSEGLWSDIRTPNITVQQRPSRTGFTQLPKAAGTIFKVPATDWIFNKGEVTLIAYVPTANNNTSRFISTCHVP